MEAETVDTDTDEVVRKIGDDEFRKRVTELATDVTTKERTEADTNKAHKDAKKSLEEAQKKLNAYIRGDDTPLFQSGEEREDVK